MWLLQISDFGMSRDLQAENYYVTRGGDIPVKWTAPETLNYKKYSAATDIWSFGCLMYEIWGLGHKPFEGHTNMEARIAWSPLQHSSTDISAGNRVGGERISPSPSPGLSQTSISPRDPVLVKDMHL